MHYRVRKTDATGRTVVIQDDIPTRKDAKRVARKHWRDGDTTWVDTICKRREDAVPDDEVPGNPEDDVVVNVEVHDED